VALCSGLLGAREALEQQEKEEKKLRKANDKKLKEAASL
jgi:hypothetical protein